MVLQKNNELINRILDLNLRYTYILYLESSTVCHITYKVQLSGKCVFILYEEAFEGAHHRGGEFSGRV